MLLQHGHRALVSPSAQGRRPNLRRHDSMQHLPGFQQLWEVLLPQLYAPTGWLRSALRPHGCEGVVPGAAGSLKGGRALVLEIQECPRPSTPRDQRTERIRRTLRDVCACLFQTQNTFKPQKSQT